MVQLISSIIDIRTSCYAARLAAFSYPQKHCKALFFEVPSSYSRSYNAHAIVSVDSLHRELQNWLRPTSNYWRAQEEVQFPQHPTPL